MGTHLVRYDMNQRKGVYIHLNDMKNVLSVDYDYAGQTIIYADITLDKIMRMNLTTGKNLLFSFPFNFFCDELFFQYSEQN